MTTKTESAWFRGMIGIVSLFGALGGFAALFFVEIPAGNRDAMMLALGIVMGWGGSIVASEYGSTATGRKVTDSAIRNIERQQVAAAGPPVPADAVEAAEIVAGAAVDAADNVKDAQ